MPAGIEQYDSMFSVRETPWHKLGIVLDDYPGSIQEALLASGLEWRVAQSPIYIDNPADTDTTIEVEGYRANIREDTGELLGVVGDDYTIVQNSEAFDFMDSLIASDLHFETAGSIRNGRRVWVLARLPEFVEVGGDPTATFVYVANSHDGSLAVTAAVTPIRIVCQNTLGFALRDSEKKADRTFKFRHTGENLALKFQEARQVLQLTINYEQQFKALGDRLAQQKFTDAKFDKVARKITKLDEDDLGKKALTIREKNLATLNAIWNGDGEDGDTRGNAPGTKWAAVNAIGEYADWERRQTKRTNQIARSFEDTDLKQRGLELVLAE